MHSIYLVFCLRKAHEPVNSTHLFEDWSNAILMHANKIGPKFTLQFCHKIIIVTHICTFFHKLRKEPVFALRRKRMLGRLVRWIKFSSQHRSGFIRPTIGRHFAHLYLFPDSNRRNWVLIRRFCKESPSHNWWKWIAALRGQNMAHVSAKNSLTRRFLLVKWAPTTLRQKFYFYFLLKNKDREHNIVQCFPSQRCKQRVQRPECNKL